MTCRMHRVFSYTNKTPPHRIVPREDVEQRFNITLRSCPFCGSGMVGLFDGPTPHITCTSCGADGPLPHQSGGQNTSAYVAVAGWNSRVDQEEQKK